MVGIGHGIAGGGPPPIWLAQAGAVLPRTPAEVTDAKVIRVALLARTSTEDQQDPTISIPRQLRACQQALPEAAVIVAHFYDIESGRKDLAERGRTWTHQQLGIPVRRDGGIQDLLAEADNGQARFDAVICESIERIARRTYYGTLIEYRLERAGIPLLAADEPINLTGRSIRNATQVLTRRVKQSIAEWYVLDMLEKSWGGFEEHTRQGFNIGQPPYGYLADKIPHPVPARRAEGKTKTRLTPDPLRGPAVQQIFTWRAIDRHTHEDIAARLNADPARYPPPMPTDPSRALGLWTKQAVRDVLRNPKYTGHMVWNRRATKSGGRNNPQNEWIWSTLPTHPALVSVEMFVLASTETTHTGRTRAAAGPNTNHPATLHTYALRAYIACGLCDHAMFGKSRHNNSYYCCAPAKHLLPPGHPATVYVREQRVLEAVTKFLLEYVFGEDQESLLHTGSDRDPATASSRLTYRAASLEAAIADLDQRRARQIRALELADGDEGFVREIRSRVAELGAERTALVDALAEIKAQHPIVDRTAIRTFPIGRLDLARMDDQPRRKLFDLVQLQLRYSKDTNSLHCKVSINPHNLPPLLHHLAACGLDVATTAWLDALAAMDHLAIATEPTAPLLPPLTVEATIDL